MIMTPTPTNSNIALKEWSATCCALALGQQIILLRKGGLLDPEGKFDLEYSGFWLAPTKWHEDTSLVKSQHQDLLQPAPAPAGVLRLAAWAQVEKSWAVSFEGREKLARLNHIWSTSYLDSRWNYQPERPLIVVALRVWKLPAVLEVPSQPEYSGCRSWIEMNESLAIQNAQPALSDSQFADALESAERVLSA